MEAYNSRKQSYIFFCIADKFPQYSKSFLTLIYKGTLGELPDFEVMTWQPCHLQHFVLVCFSSKAEQKYKIKSSTSF